MSILESQLARPITPHSFLWTSSAPPTNDGAGSLIFSVASHTLETGDLVYLRIGDNSSIGVYGKRYIIRISSTQFKLATSVQNAVNSIADSTLPTSGVGWAVTTNLVSNLTAFNTTAWRELVYRLSFNEANARSSVAFNINQPVRFDWIYPSSTFSGYSLSNVVGLSTANEATSFALLGPPPFLISGQGNSQYNVIGVSNTSGYQGRISITSDRRVSISVAPPNSNTYTTLWTSSQQSADLAPLFFYSTFAYAGQKITNCTITYL